MTSGSSALASRTNYLATPVVTRDDAGPWPGVVLVHDAFGVSDDMREQADWLAAAGYLTAVPDLYNGKGAVRCIRAAFGQLQAQQGPMFDQIEGVRASLADDPRCTGAVGVIGYCMGGGFALVLAGRPGYRAASVNYGVVPENVEEILAGACPVVASFGGLDKGLKGAAETVQSAAEKAGISADVHEYPDARHGFINRLVATSPLSPMLKIAGVGYNHAAAADAKRRILTFFDDHLRGDAVTDPVSDEVKVEPTS